MGWDDETDLLTYDMVLRTTDKAALLDLGEGEQHWFPFSQVPDLEEIGVGDGPGEVEVPVWMLRDKELI